MRLFKYLGKHMGAVVLVFLLLIALADCQLRGDDVVCGGAQLGR